MPTVILLDVSFSMCRPVPSDGTTEEEEGNAPILRKDLAALACCQLLDHLTLTNKLEFVSLVIYSSLYEVVVGFTRDYSSVRKAVLQVGDYDKTCLHSALTGTVHYCKEEWGNSMPCQLLVITDGTAGVGQSGFLRSLSGPRAAQNFPLPFTVPATLDIVCLASADDPALLWSLPLYQRYVELNGHGSVHVPQGKLSKKSARDLMSEVLRTQFCPYRGELHCGNLCTHVTLAPPPQYVNESTRFNNVLELVMTITNLSINSLEVTDKIDDLQMIDFTLEVQDPNTRTQHKQVLYYKRTLKKPSTKFPTKDSWLKKKRMECEATTPSRWIRNWLTGRTQRVVIHDQASDSALATSGVSHGSVLGSLLFIIYVNDLDVGIINKINKFADDTKLCHRAFTERDRVTIQSDLNRLLQWTETW
ncbi:Reverse transcriptase domain [Trinorchestia longiramus]|nr:Reverse transcriptase domain [Trinorchestia longiramus]